MRDEFGKGEVDMSSKYSHFDKRNDATKPIKPQAEINVLALHRKTALN